MYIARWTVTVVEGQLDAYLALLKKWQLDVGLRAGWKPDSVRVVSGCLGGAQNEVQYEVHIDELNDLQLAWNDIARNPSQKEYLAAFAPMISPGTNRWDVFMKQSVSAD